MRKKIAWLMVVLSVLLALTAMTPTLAATEASLTLYMRPNARFPDMSGITFALYKVGHTNGSKGEAFEMDEAFASVDFLNAETARQIDAAADAVTALIRSTGLRPVATARTGANGRAVFSNIETGIYYATMTQGPATMTVQALLVTVPQFDGERMTYDVTAEPKYAYVPPEEPEEPEPTPEPVVDVSGQKFWVDNNNEHRVRPASITVTLFANGVAQDATPTWEYTGNTWTYTFRNLPELDAEGNAIEYTVRETAVPYYQTTLNGNDITNTVEEREPGDYIDVNGVKTWNDNNNADGLRPESITIRLLRNGAQFGQRTVTEADNWSWSFTELPTDDGYGHTYTYVIREDPVANYYTQINGNNVTNTRLPEPPPPENPPEREEELEELVELLDYDVPLFGMLLETGDDLPAYPFVFAGLGVVSLVLFFLMGRKRKGSDEAK